jgi:hypothetical protein
MTVRKYLCGYVYVCSYVCVYVFVKIFKKSIFFWILIKNQKIQRKSKNIVKKHKRIKENKN